MLIAIGMLSCNKGTNTGFDYTQNIVNIEGEPLPINQLIGRPTDIACIDTLLVYKDIYEEKVLSVFDLKNSNFIGRFVSEGQGPNEVYPSRIFFLQYPQKDKLHIYQSNASILTTIEVPGFNISDKFTVSPATGHSTEIQRTKDYYIGFGIFENGRFGVYNSNVEYMYAGADYPFTGSNMEPSQAFATYQGKYCTNPEGNYFAMGCWFSDHIAFYEVTDTEIVTLKEYSSYDANVDVNTTENRSSMRPKDETIINYNAAFGTASYCYMLFSGKTYGETGKFSGGRHIVVFDWKGNYIKTYNTDYEIENFCVDENNNCIYATSLNESGDYSILRFNI
jgi:hypothetical protein